MPKPYKANHPSPFLYHVSIALTATVGLVLGLWIWLGSGWGWAQWLGAWLVAINVTAFGYYGLDKSRASNAGRRVPELVLHALALAGGSIGAFAGMQLFRHKTVKGNFRIAFWLIVAIQLVLMGWLIKEVWWRPALHGSAASLDTALPYLWQIGLPFAWQTRLAG